MHSKSLTLILTREEFAAQDAVQKIIGPNGNPDLVDGFYEIYRNRNTKRWIEHKQLLQNSTNKYPEFVNQIIFEAQQQGPIENIDALLSSARRRFLEVNFVDGTVRPEVLQGAGVFDALNKTNNAFKNQLLQEKGLDRLHSSSLTAWLRLLTYGLEKVLLAFYVLMQKTLRMKSVHILQTL